MTERKSTVIKAFKKSSISKVKIITVHSNDVASLTSRHPVGIVIAERRNPQQVSSSGKEPRPVFIPGCPLPQVLPPQHQAATHYSIKDKSKANSHTQIYRPGKYVKHKQVSKLPKNVAFNIDHDVEIDRVYDPQNYVTSQESEFLRQSHTQQPNPENTVYTGEERATTTLLSGSPHYVLVSQRKRDEADLDSCNFLMDGSISLESHSENSEASSVTSNEEMLTPNSLTSAPLSTGITQVFPVKRGCLHIRQKPHQGSHIKYIKPQGK
ncbi:uncharacterized protein [Cherax quadricarinatus]|uniref:uncharacterized protein isoform X2 n=1 Tax=Cherax quadricarinatus TaxID=27406 RepID=UPI002378DB74|nr:uncharacterized protein LOC128691425 isoform X2 [Cherax quadricarinatus]